MDIRLATKEVYTVDANTKQTYNIEDFDRQGEEEINRAGDLSVIVQSAMLVRSSHQGISGIAWKALIMSTARDDPSPA